MSTRLALGTVQFGMPYGIANKDGQVSRVEAAAILGEARAAGVDTLDTAIAYGASERILGEIGVPGWRIVSKLPGVPEHGVDVQGWVADLVRDSLARLGVPRLYGLLLHRASDLLGSRGEALHCALTAMKDEGKVTRIGISVYGPEELDAIASRYRLDLVQSPFNVLDRRIESSGWLARLRDNGTELHVRSVFLQGLLLMPASSRPSRFSRWNELWGKWEHWVVQQELTPLQACLAFVMARPGVDRVVVGVDSLPHLREILAAAGTIAADVPETLMTEDVELINPFRWSAT